MSLSRCKFLYNMAVNYYKCALIGGGGFKYLFEMLYLFVIGLF